MKTGSIPQFCGAPLGARKTGRPKGRSSSLPEAHRPTPRITSGAQLLNRAVVGQNRSENRPDESIVFNTARHKLRYEYVDEGAADRATSPRT
jgi:hypothetical protein